ncbi:MAG: DUF1501 domain-containing protein [Gemmataceae bacterium]
MLQPIVDLGVNRDGVLSRRGFVKSLAAGVAFGALGWRDLLMAKAADLRKQGKSMILLWMDGGPSQFETFNPKDGSPNQGPCKSIETNVTGVRFADFWPKTAKVMDKIALIRSMQSKEAEHDRAIALVRTGYPINAAIRYPTFGSVVAMKRDDANFELPAFVRIGKPRIATRDVDAGVLGVRYSSFNIDTAGQLPPNVLPGVSPEVLKRRLSLAQKLDAEFERKGEKEAVAEKKQVYDRTARFVLSPRLNTFDLEKEPARLRDSYGRTNFGQGCLLARRLVEQGTSFIEVISTGDKNDAGWDTHGKGFQDQPNLCAEVDPAYSTLLLDLADRGLLDKTLVVWMGEFGRTPKLKSDGGRDHYPNGWLTALSGAGIKTGQVIGATDKDGVKVSERPVLVQDLFQTFCQVLGIDPDEEYQTADARPIKLVEGGRPISELL